MKAALYAVSSGSSWQWHTTICWEADAAYWRNRTKGEAELWLVQPRLSFGQAERIGRLLTARQRQYPQAVPSELMSSLQTAPQYRRLFQHPQQRNSYYIPELAVQRVTLHSSFLPASIHNDEYAELLRLLDGRHLLMDEALAMASHHGLRLGDNLSRLTFAVQLARLRGELTVEPGLRCVELARRFLWRRNDVRFMYVCERCGSGEERLRWTDCPHCGQACPYCEECLTMGRVRACTPLIRGATKAEGQAKIAGRIAVPEINELLAPWGLSDAQAAASREGLKFLLGSQETHRHGQATDPPCFLIWAVTGAGKTEMIFPFLSATLAAGGRTLVATPRKDVVLELSPRVQRAFPQAKVVTLFGGSEQRWDNGDIVIATTHQLMRFREGFDAIVIDELDAFPFHNNPSLTYAARKACKPQGRYILMSATPPIEMQRTARRDRLPHVKVPVRYHRHPLPVPQLRSSVSLAKMIAAGRPSRSLFQSVRRSLLRGAQIFIFVPGIALVEPLVTLLRHKESDCCIQGTSSKDPERVRKVQDFREGAVSILVTTTILERGVTVPKSDVIVLDADSRLFDEASLVQMAGRAGRSAADPAGNVWFLAGDRTRSQTSAVRHIRSMNRLAKKQGYIS